MLNSTEIIEKLHFILKQKNPEPNKKIFDKDVAEALNISQANFATMKNRNKIPFLEIATFCHENGISINDVLYEENSKDFMLNKKKNSVDFYESVSEGNPRKLKESSRKISFCLAEMLNGTIDLTSIKAIRMEDETMLPTYKAGAVLYFDMSQKEIDNSVFIFIVNKKIYVRRLQKKMNGNILSIPDNKQYTEEEVSFKDISILGKVIASFQKS